MRCLDKKIIKKLDAIKPDLLLYSSFTPDIPKYAALDRLIKEKISVTSLIGGHGPTYDPDHIANTTIDALCMGEGEAALVEFVDNGFSGTKNIVNRLEITPERCNTSDYFAFLGKFRTPKMVVRRPLITLPYFYV